MRTASYPRKLARTYRLVSRASAAGLAIAALFFASFTEPLIWVPQGAGPNTLGQDENIEDREVAGAIRAVAPHPTEANIVYVGAVNGGIWKTTNATASSPHWEQLTDTQKSLSIGALGFDPTDSSHQTLVAGTGWFSSYWFGSPKAGGALVGLMRTTNGGINWTTLDGGGILKGLNISGVAPRGDTIVISASNAGIFRSANPAMGWTKISGSLNTGLPAGISFDLAGDPLNPARLFTNAGTLGIYRSTDTGFTWTKISDADIDAHLNPNTVNVKIAVGQHDDIYVAIADAKDRNNPDSTGHLVGLFRSSNGGNTWTSLDLPGTVEEGSISFDLHPGGQAQIHLSIAADPANPNIVYIGGDRQPAANETLDPQNPRWPNSIKAQDYSGRLFRIDASRPTGSQATHLTHSNTASNSAPHADSRNMAVALNGDLLEVDDGGIYRRTNPRTNSGDWFSMNGNLQITEFHSVAWDANSHIIIGGAQDTGTLEQQKTSDTRWRSVTTGDGGVVAVDDTSTPGYSVRYSSYQNLGFFSRRVYDAANVFQSEVFPALRLLGNGNALQTTFYTPVELNRVVPTRLIIGADNAVYESLDQGDTIREVGPNIRVNETGPIAYGAKDNPNILYVGADSQVFIRVVSGAAPLVRSAAYPGRANVVGIALDPDHSKTAYVIDESNVYRTTNAGVLWSNITGNLLTLDPVVLRSVAFVNGTGGGAVIVGTNKGVFVASGPGFSTWSRFGSGIPNAPIFRLIYNAKDKKLLAGSLGRGTWTLDLK